MKPNPITVILFCSSLLFSVIGFLMVDKLISIDRRIETITSKVELAQNEIAAIKIESARRAIQLDYLMELHKWQ